jgi:hypothetical protein
MSMTVWHGSDAGIPLDAYDVLNETWIMTSTLWTTVRDELRERRDARAHERRLREDLAPYSTPAEIKDLLSAVDREETRDAEVIRSILHENLARYHAARAPRQRVAGF